MRDGSNFEHQPTGPAIALGAGGVIRLILIESRGEDAERLRSLLATHTVEVVCTHVPDVEAAETVLASCEADVVLLALERPELDGPSEFERVQALVPNVPVLVLTAADVPVVALDLLKRGAQDVLAKAELTVGLLGRAVAYAIERHAAQLQAAEQLRKLEASEARFRTMVESSLDGILVIDRHCIVRFANPAACRMLETDEPLVDNLLQIPVHQNATEPLHIVSPDGGRSLAEMKIVGIDWYGERAWMAAIRDLAERVRIEQLEQRIDDTSALVAKMEELDRVRGEFIESVTHELRTPMTPLRSAVEMLLDGTLGEIDPRHRNVLEMMARNIERLSRFATGVLTLSQIDSGSYPISPSAIDVRQTIVPVVELWAARAIDRGSRLALDADPGLCAYADADALCQVVGNLIENALSHNDPGVVIEVIAKPAGDDRVLVEVRDDGKGIDAVAQARIFEKFFQAARQSGPGYKGTGLGLALSKSFVESMGGVFQLDSRPGAGASFSFLLPRPAASLEAK